ncbi:MAG: DUF2249 domain-containing protein [Vulcanimicrobiaceae bacterium]
MRPVTDRTFEPRYAGAQTHPAEGPMQPNTPPADELDVRIIEPRFKHSTIHDRLKKLSSGQTLTIVNDHDPRPLRFELEADYPHAFEWSYREQGPQIWRVEIRKM